MREYYQCRSLDGGRWQMLKWEAFNNGALGELQAVYNLWRGRPRIRCDCPAHDFHCRHTDMLVAFLTDNKLNKGWFLDATRWLWIKPVTGATDV